MTTKQMIMVGLGAVAVAAAPVLLFQYGPASTRIMAFNIVEPIAKFGRTVGIVKTEDIDKGDFTSYYMFCAAIGAAAVALMYLYLKFVNKSI